MQCDVNLLCWNFVRSRDLCVHSTNHLLSHPFQTRTRPLAKDRAVCGVLLIYLSKAVCSYTDDGATSDALCR